MRHSLYPLLILLVLCVAPLEASAQATRLKTSYSSITANNSPVWIAKDKGLFSKNKLDVQMVLIESGTTSIQALVAGETQIAQLSGGVILSSGLAGSDVVCISGLENRSAFSLIAQKEIKTAEQLKGKRLAISRFGTRPSARSSAPSPRPRARRGAGAAWDRTRAGRAAAGASRSRPRW